MPTEAKILAAGRQILAAEGLHAITTNEIARRAHVSKKTLYRLFSSKDRLLEAVVVSLLDESLAHWEAIFERDDSTIERVLAALEFVSQFLPQIQNQVIGEIETTAPSLWETIDRIRILQLGKLKTLMEEAQGEGYLRKDVDPDHWVLLLTGAIRAVLTPPALLRTGIPLSDLVRSIRSIYYDGLLTDEGRRLLERAEERSS